MYTLKLSGLSLSVDFTVGHIDSVFLGGKERVSEKCPLFKLSLRDADGAAIERDAYGASERLATSDGAIYTYSDGLAVRVRLTENNGESEWRIEITGVLADMLVEHVEFPRVVMGALKENGGEAEMLLPYNEGSIISDIRVKNWLLNNEIKYPSLGCYPMFPNMLCSQMMSYMLDNCSLYMGAHDARRAEKAIYFSEYGAGVMLQMRLYCGGEYGDGYKSDYPIVWACVGGDWQDCAERYRAWFESSLPKRVKKVKENPDLPEWYADSPLVVSYPVRGIHDTDIMEPNKLYPYTNALPVIDSIKEATDSRVLALLMHWEGTAPWAPPYVWPPYGELDNFNEFMNRLHAQGDMLGVYCSGFGYTKQSNLIAEYNGEAEYERDGLERAMCAAPDGKVYLSKICTAQRSGYDICPASELGKSLLKKAYQPLFDTELDYVQILDQNHGGAQYLCYSREHGHPAAPGAWMTENMQDMLSDWQDSARGKLFGCESAASEAFIGNLLFSDNRFELNYMVGRPVPFYAYVYHEYLRNFMGNQVCCRLEENELTLCYRLAYSFSIGDCMTLVLSPDGDLLSNWGQRDFSRLPKKETVLRLIKNLTRFYKEEAKEYLYAGKMIKGERLECDTVTFITTDEGRVLTLPKLHSAAYEGEDGKRVQILVNPTEDAQVCKLGGKEISVPSLDAVIVKI